MKHETRQEIDDAFNDYVEEVVGVLVALAASAYNTGMLTAQYLVKGYTASPAQLYMYTRAYMADYQRMLVEKGGTEIDGVFVPWLIDSKIELRQKVFDIINDGLERGTPPDAIAAELRTVLVDDQLSHALLIATNEATTLRNRGLDRIYENAGVEFVTCVFGPNPCPMCIPHIGRVYRRSEAPYLPRHPYCREYYVPVYY